MEHLEVFELFTGTDVHDGTVEHFFDRQSGPASGITVDLGQDDTVDRDGLVEGLRRCDRFLSDHRIDDQQGRIRTYGSLDLSEFLHQLRVDGESTGGVDDDDVTAQFRSLGTSRLGNRHRTDRLGVHGNIDLSSEGPQLLDRRRALQVGTDEERLMPLTLQQTGEFAHRRCLTSTLEASHQNHGRGLRIDRNGASRTTEGVDQLFVNDLDDHLPRREARSDVFTHRSLTHSADEALDHTEVDVGFEQRKTDLSHRVVDIGLGELPSALQPSKNAVEARRQCVKHVCS